MKTLHLDTGDTMGGGQWQVLRLVRGLASRGDQPFLLAREDGQLLVRALAEGLPAKPFRWSGWPTADLIHAHDAHSHTAASFFLGAPLVVSRRVAFPVMRGVSKLKYSRPNRFIAVSRFVAGILVEAGVPEQKIDVVYDGVPLLPFTKERTRVIAPANKAIEGYFASTDLERDLRTASAFVYISKSEGLGSAILLAMSAGVPVVASKVGGIPEIVTNNEDGILVNDNQIEEAVKTVEEHSVLYGTRARQKIIDRFQESRMVEETWNVYRKLLAHV
jgi:glycosyltransferase involved in cell wall biosynthesis